MKRIVLVFRKAQRGLELVLIDPPFTVNALRLAISINEIQRARA